MITPATLSAGSCARRCGPRMSPIRWNGHWRHQAVTRCTCCILPSANTGQDRALAPSPQEPHPAGELLSARRSGSAGRSVRRILQSPALPRELEKRHIRRCLFWQGKIYHQTKRKDQAKNHRTSALVIPQDRSVISTVRWSQLLTHFKTTSVSNYLTTDKYRFMTGRVYIGFRAMFSIGSSPRH